MRTAETVLNILRERGQRGLPVEKLYRLLFRRDLYLRAYAKLYANDGAMTRGVTEETVDGMSLKKIDGIIDAVRREAYHWSPARRTYIPKKNGKLRPLGMPTWSDKLLQEVIRSLLEAYYEPQFSPHSHGFRPGRGCHTALREIQANGKGTKWFIEGDLCQCFDRIDHTVLMGILAEKIHDNRFLRLIRNLLDAGYLEEWRLHDTYSGVPQGGVISPLLSNLVLDKLDKYVETQLIPANTRGRCRKSNPEYVRKTVAAYRARKRGNHERAEALMREARGLPSREPDDPKFRRLWYQRYADDFLLGFIGPRAEAEEIKQRVGAYLRDELKLELNQDKTLITHARNGRAKFLGYEVHAMHADCWRDSRGERGINGGIGFRVPRAVVNAHCARYMEHGKPVHLPQRLNDGVYSIIVRYQAEYGGLVQYYRLAYNLGALQKVKWAAQVSLVKTLANKLRTTCRRIYRRFGATLWTPEGRYKVIQVVVPRPGKEPLEAHFGAIPLKRNPWAAICESERKIWSGRSELLERLLAQKCELCGGPDDIEVHHIRKLADLHKKGRSRPKWMEIMAARRRKTLIVCRGCHDEIHYGRYDGAAVA